MNNESISLIFHIHIILDKILSYLRPIDLIVFKSLNKYIYKECQKLIKYKLINSKVHDGFFDDEEITELYTFLNKDCVISGSYFLQLLLDEKYNDYDLDIYATTKEYNRVKYILTKFGYENTSYIDYDTSTGRFDDDELETSTRIMYNTINISTISEYIRIINGKTYKVQFLITAPDEYVHDIIENFDFSILKNYYDGSYIKIYNKQNVSNKENTIHIYELNKKRIRRMQKYKHRNIKFTVIFRKSDFRNSGYKLQRLMSRNIIDLDSLILANDE